MAEFIKTIFLEMTDGNFSFFILVVGVAQYVEMVKKNKSRKVGGK